MFDNFSEEFLGPFSLTERFVVPYKFPEGVALTSFLFRVPCFADKLVAMQP